MKKEMIITAEVELEEIADELRHMDYEDVVSFIISLDLSMADWDFTLKLCEHFDKIRRDYEAENGVDKDED